jgi:opacity protein-like surface antigen
MRTSALVALLMACSAALDRAQDGEGPPFPKYEVFAGYSQLKTGYLFLNFGNATTDVDSKAGFETSAVRNLNRYLGIKGDFSAHFGSDGYPITILPSCSQMPCPSFNQDLNIHSRLFNFLAGPEVKLHRRARFTPYLQALYGVAHTTSKWSTSGPALSTVQTVPHTGFAMDYGGGLDIRLTSRVAFRYGLDYSLNYYLGGRDIAGTRERLDTFRMSFGVLFH